MSNINKIQIKRGSGAPGLGVLDDGELGWDKKGKKLYIGESLESIPIQISGVTSVNNKTGAVSLTASDVGAAVSSQGDGIADKAGGIVFKSLPHDATNYTIPQLKEYIASWINADTSKLKAEAIRMGSPIDKWNSGNTTDVLGWGGWWYVVQVATDDTANYAKFLLNGYGDTNLYYVSCNRGIWSNIQKVITSESSDFVPTSRTVNGKALSGNISLSASDVGAAESSHGTHVSYGTSASALGTSSAGSASTVSRSDHVHALPALTSCAGTLSVAKGGTGATTADAALANLGGTKFELLWENATPLAAFEAQTISIPKITTNYRMVLIDCLEHWSTGAWRWYHASAIAQTNCDAGYGNGTPTRVMSFGEEGCDISYRPFTIHSDSIYFSTGYYTTTFSASTPANSNNILVPLRIYGIK